MIDLKPHLRWSLSYLPPKDYRTFKDWALYTKTGDGLTVVRVFGFTVRVFK